MASKNHYIDSKVMMKEWMKIYYWENIELCEPCDQSTMMARVSGYGKEFYLNSNVDDVDDIELESDLVGMKYLNETLTLEGQPSELLGSMFKKLAYKTITHRCFMQYSFKDDMAGDALLNMVRYANRYNPEKTTNIFSYFTKIAFNASIVRLKKEEKSRNIISKFQEENFPRLMMEQSEGKCQVYINPNCSMTDSINKLEKDVNAEENNWN